MNSRELKNLVRSFGSQQEFADKLSKRCGREVSQQSVSQWIVRGAVPVWTCAFIEAMTGRDVTAHQLRPDAFPEHF